MKNFILFLLSLLLMVAIAIGLIFAYREMSGERQAEAQTEKPVVAESRVKRDPNGNAVVTLEAAAQKQIGLQTATLTAGTLDREIKAYGRVLDPSSLAVFNSEINSAQAALAAAAKELERVKKLYDQGQNASLRAVEIAEAEVRRDQLALESARDRLALAWGKTVAQQSDFGAFVRAFTGWENALIRLDLPPGESLKSPPGRARIAPLSDETALADAAFFDVPPATEPPTQTQGFVYLAKGTGWPPGTMVAGYLKAPGEPWSGVIIPRAAVVRAAGLAWAYLQTGADTFTRRPVALERPTPEGWLVQGGWKAGDRVVITGAQTLLSEELKAQIHMVE